MKWMYYLLPCLRISEEDRELLKQIQKKQKELSEYGGRMVVSGRGALRHEFDAKEG